MQFLDANVIAYAFYDNPNLNACQAALRGSGVTDTFALAEAFHIIEMETGSRATAQKAVRGLLKLSIVVVPVDVNVIFETMKKLGKTKLSVFDAIHYTCCRLGGCDSFLSYDNDFDNLDVQRAEP